MKKYDLIVIGAGPAGMTSALYASRADLSVLLLDRGVYGGQMNNTSAIENYPGFKSILGPDLSKKMYQNAINFNAEYTYGSVQSIENHGKHKLVHTDNGDYESSAIIIATGSKNRELKVPGEKEYSGRGVSYCAVCDGAFFKGKRVVVVGGGDSAIQESIYLSQLASEVIVIHRRSHLRAQKILQDRAFKNDKIKFIWNSNVEEIIGDKMKVNGVKIMNNKTNQESTVDASGVFVYIGILPMTDQFKDLSITDNKGWIKANDRMETAIPGIFAAGDVREKELRQIVTSTGDGGIAGQNAFNYIQSLN